MSNWTPKILVANRGEIAIRICRSASELGWRTVALYTQGDASHASYADEAILLDSAAQYMNTEHIAKLAREAQCTHVHPGYGFLSESPKLARLFSSVGDHSRTSSDTYGLAITFVGPSVETLEIASDKMRSRELAISQGVPVTPGARVSSPEDVRAFARTNGLPTIIKALDGGGGRGIRLVHAGDEIDSAFSRCVGESASRLVFVEKAFVGPGWRHVEVQIVGDGSGDVTHLWERECSIQRRFQKIVEMAPSTLPRDMAEPLIQAALKMARQLRYAGLGTFEFLFNGQSQEWIFLEINPRIQVEHTVTEEIMNLDLVRVQLLLALPGASLAAVLPRHTPSPPPPRSHAIQLRLVAEDPHNAFRLSTGTIQASDVSWPAGRGVRIDTWLSSGPCGPGDSRWTIGVDFDSLLAKIVVHGGTFEEATSRASRALRETTVRGEVKTNLELLAGIVNHPNWKAGATHTRWLEEHVEEVLRLGQQHLHVQKHRLSATPEPRDAAHRTSGDSQQASPGTILLPPGVSFQLTLSNSSAPGASDDEQKHNLVLSSIGHNAFPDRLSGTISTSLALAPLSFSLTQLSSLPTSSQTEYANPRDPTHLASPLAGKVVELHPAFTAAAEGSETGRHVRQGEPLVVISLMKMESVVNAPATGKVVRAGKGVEVGAVIGEGTLLCVLVPGEAPSAGGLARL
ncbi:carboxylase:pyruvate/acetyl-coa/propionyl-CoA [Trametes cingulata]|nr:carboxylase:pyruvate/acetyl-coa/propionyl-CoA [Trametes cingulata]